MKKIVSLFAVVVVFGSFGLVACGGGNDKEPMTPDNVEGQPAPSGVDTDAAAPSTETPPSN